MLRMTLVFGPHPQTLLAHMVTAPYPSLNRCFYDLERGVRLFIFGSRMRGEVLQISSISMGDSLFDNALVAAQ